MRDNISIIVSALLLFIVLLGAAESNAEAWLVRYGRQEVSLEHIFAPLDEASIQSVQVWSNGDFIIHNLERIQKYNWQESAYEYGLHDHWSITANAIIQHFRGLFISSYQKRETGDNGIDEVNIAEGAEIDEFFHAVTLGAKHQLFRHDHDILSVHWRGQLWDRKMQNQLASIVTLSYGRSFGLPFDYAPRRHFFECSIGMKNGLKGLNTKHIGLLNANIGVRPIGPDMALIAGIYSTIGRHTATSPSWHSVNIPEEHNNTANRLLSKKDTIKAYHTLALQLAFSLPNGAAYLKTFRPVHSSFSSLQRHSWALSIQLEM